MSGNTAWQDVVEAANRPESNLASYERGYKAGRYIGFHSWQAAVTYANEEIKETADGTQ